MYYSKKQLLEIFPNAFFYNVATHDYIGPESKKLINKDHNIVCGTNLLSSNMNHYNQWKINLKETLYLKPVVLLGVGWWQYQGYINRYSRYLYRKILTRSHLHSVRDQYTLNKLTKIQITNVLNTGCPTMWSLDSDHCLSIPKSKKDTSVFTLTDYSRHPELDQFLIDSINDNYQRIFFWPQGSRDLKYLIDLLKDKKELLKKINLIPATFEEFKCFLEKNECDYIGTRLHAGIMALNHHKRSIIIGVDNRALEISNDTNLEVIDRKSLKEKLNYKINSNFSTNINMDFNSITKFKTQFN